MRGRPTSHKISQGLGFPASLALHLCVIASFFITWTHKFEIADSAPVVPVELVTLADKTDIAPMAAEQPKPEDEPVQNDTQARETPAEEIAPADEQKPMPKPAPPKPKDQFDADNILALLDKKKKPPPQQTGKPGQQNIKGFGAQDQMTADLKAMLKGQVYKCWSPPVGAPHPEKLTVEFQMTLRRDGTVAQADLYATGLPRSDPFMRAAAEAARRAIYTCAPYKLPADRYEHWQSFTFVFDPRDMF